MDAPPGFKLLRPIAMSETTQTWLAAGDAGEVICKRATTRGLTESVVQRSLEREAEFLVALDGRGAPRCIAHGIDASGPYIVTERLPMHPLARWIGGAPAVPLEWHVSAARALFDALARIHANERAGAALAIVHGDISPHNLLVTADAGEGRIVDFGCARYANEVAAGHRTFRGTLLYTAPEVARGERPTILSDWYSCSLSVLHCASGFPPRANVDAPAALLVEAGETTADAFLERCEAVLPRRFVRALGRCLRFDPAERLPLDATKL